MGSDVDLFYGTSGPHDAKAVLVGESWGVEEQQAKVPFVGASGSDLRRMLAEARIDPSDILFTNLIAARPLGNETWRFFLPKNTKPPRIAGIAPGPEATAEIRRLYQQISAHPRRLVIGAGNWPLWALSQHSTPQVLRDSNKRLIPSDQQTWVPGGIMSWRGSMCYTAGHAEFGPLPITPFLPVIHPAAVLRQWSLRAPTIHDFRTRIPMALRQDWRQDPSPVVWAPPTFANATSRLRYWLNEARRGQQVRLAVDIETLQQFFISCIGFCDGPSFAMSIPFVRNDAPDGTFDSFWSIPQEAEIVSLIRQVLNHPNIKIIGQNFIYDTQYLRYWLGATPRLSFDTMLAQNVLFPGTPKTLEYLSSLYCKYHWYWKDDNKDWKRVGNLHTLLHYNCTDVLRTHEIATAQQDVLEKLKQTDQMAFKMRTNDLCLRMMSRGVAIDVPRRGAVVFELQEALSTLERELLEIIPQDFVQPHTKKGDVFWYRSDRQTAHLFYDILGMKPVLNRKTGSRTVGKEALGILEKRYPEFTALFRRLDRAGSMDNTINVCRAPLDPDGRMRCSYNPGGTETHRLSSSKNAFGKGTNLQNLSKGEEDD